MLAQTDLVNEVKVSIEDLLRRMAADHLYEQGDDALDDERVAVGSKHELAVDKVALQPHTALTAVDEVLLGLVFLVEWFEIIA